MSCYEIRIYRVAENSKFKRLFALPAIQSIQNLQHDTTACVSICVRFRYKVQVFVHLTCNETRFGRIF